MPFVPLDHPRFKKVETGIFVRRLAPDCMAHQCAMVVNPPHEKLDACCQYGVDVDLGERDGILEKQSDIRKLLHPEVADLPWFGDKIETDADFPSGSFVRTQRVDNGCLFLQHDGRGCAIHRASIENNWDFHGIKPHVCRLFPVSYTTDEIVISDDYADYSCAYQLDAPTIYEVQRNDIGAIFGQDLLVALDKVRDQVLAQLEAGEQDTRSTLPVVSAPPEAS